MHTTTIPQTDVIIPFTVIIIHLELYSISRITTQPTTDKTPTRPHNINTTCINHHQQNRRKQNNEQKYTHKCTHQTHTNAKEKYCKKNITMDATISIYTLWLTDWLYSSRRGSKRNTQTDTTHTLYIIIIMNES